ncbi:4-hydroxy-3-methylbut-2-enyl diphosphate reductase [Arcobacter sp. FWKO B]|uniref:4-hydroxy-3-methylbut-2-enyl diphosphate reductase n=1 Tax=Arcobacter sp. FWKO B TaxID=2593672 RepID=UPI0018A64048|nr:4-hydroxy-3-methylbut-2-enyl diphosphate reductase [Arcobacter sp. FWKO B]QOG12639.1 4-hydroxy-3-methylbut-2-enyl diphosphate reductase [Arcobacter sp. FWKO B]
MEIKLASSYGFCFGVKRAIQIASEHQNSFTMGPLIHNQKEIDRLKNENNVGLYENIDDVNNGDTVIIRTHGIPKNDLHTLKQKEAKVINATCPFVTTPQNIVKKMSSEGYSIVIFGDSSHPEVKGVKSYGDDVYVVLNSDELKTIKFKNDKIATVAQTTRKKDEYLKIVNELMLTHKEVRVFNTICDATFENQAAARELSLEADIMIVIGGKNSSNTKQLLDICKTNCFDSYLIEDESEINPNWFKNKKLCGITAGASTPDWVIQKCVDKLREL